MASVTWSDWLAQTPSQSLFSPPCQKSESGGAEGEIGVEADAEVGENEAVEETEVGDETVAGGEMEEGIDEVEGWVEGVDGR